MNVERIHSIDGLRGFSLLGILLANMLNFQYNTFFKSVVEGDSLLNEAAYYFIKIAVEGSFYPLFSFLFGYSLIQLVESVKRQGRRLYPVLVRRATGLLIIGLVHYIFIWAGDILINYALALFVLLLFINSNVKAKLICSAICIVVAILITGVSYALGEANDKTTAAVTTVELLQNGSYLEVLKDRLAFGLSDLKLPAIVNFIVFIISMSVMTVVILPFALIGMIAAQKGYFSTNRAVAFHKHDWVLFIVLGLLLKSAILLDTFGGGLLFVTGGYVLTFGYIKLFMVLYEAVFHTRLQKFFSSLGKLSLSTYLLQSIVCTTIFYGYALGQFGKLGVAAGLLIATMLYLLQGMVSYWYVNHFKQGPVEAILRSWTYWGRKRKEEGG